MRVFHSIRRGAFAAALAISCLHGHPGLAAEEWSVLTPRGAPITVIEHIPDGPGPFPAVVLAPGSGTLRQRINDTVAAALERQGFAVYRFEWAYVVAKGTASDTERAPEIEDLKTVVALAKSNQRVDPQRIIVGGKSRGTIIGWLVLRSDPSLKGILQLTPVCTKTGFTAAQLYPDLGKEERPSLWIAGDADPACDARTLYGFIAGASKSARIASVRGDHGLGTEPTGALAAALAADFAATAVLPKAR